jgi:ribose-phosphate pyrophosphokinase
MDNLNAGPIGAAYFSEKKLVNPVVVSPDAGGVGRAKHFRKMLEQKGYKGCGLAMLIKQRSGAAKIEAMDLVGSVAGSDVIIVDDMVDTAGTLCKAAAILKKAGALKVHAFCTHGVFSGNAAQNIAGSVLDEMVVTNTVPLPPAMEATRRVVTLNVAPIIAESIKRLHKHSSISGMYDEPTPRL